MSIQLHIHVMCILCKVEYSSQDHQLKSESNNQIVLSKIFCIGYSTPDAKLFILFLYYVLLLFVIILSFTSSAQIVDSTFKNIAGYKPECDVYKEKIEDITRPSFYISLLNYAISSSINLAHLTYTLQINDIIKCLLVSSYLRNNIL